MKKSLPWMLTLTAEAPGTSQEPSGCCTVYEMRGEDGAFWFCDEVRGGRVGQKSISSILGKVPFLWMPSTVNTCSPKRFSLKILKGVEIKGDHTDKREIKDLFYDRWKMKWTRLSTCHLTKFWLEDPSSLGDALARLDCLTLGLALQATTGHIYLNYHHTSNITGNVSEQICWFSQEEHEEFTHVQVPCTRQGAPGHHPGAPA